MDEAAPFRDVPVTDTSRPPQYDRSGEEAGYTGRARNRLGRKAQGMRSRCLSATPARPGGSGRAVILGTELFGEIAFTPSRFLPAGLDRFLPARAGAH